MDKIIKKAEEYNVKIEIFRDISNLNFKEEKFSVKNQLNLNGNIPKYQFISCFHFNVCITLKSGKIYTCPIMAHIEHFNKYFNQNLTVTENDYIDIYKAKSFEEISEFLTKRPDFCKYCDIKNRKSYKWKTSDKDISEWT